MSASRYENVLSSGRIGTMTLRNRICVTAMGVSFAEEDATCGERVIQYHAEQAKGGVGLIIMGATGVAWPVGCVQPYQIAISDDRFIPGLKRLADAVHAHGGKIAAQIHHGGPNATQPGVPVWVPSEPLPQDGDFYTAYLPEEIAAMMATLDVSAVPQIKVLDQEDIRIVVQQFAAATVRAKQAGLDGVEIHGGHGYILSSFLSPAKNRRTDEYGGSLENRARLLLETIRACRAAVGPDYPIWSKLDSRELGFENGLNFEESKQVARWIEEAGADAITVSAYHHTGQGKLHSESYLPHTPNANVPYAAAIKQEVGIPIIASGRIEPEDADEMIGEGKFDFLSMGRKLLADPHLPNKLAANRADDIRPCIYCYTCVSAIYTRESTRCAVNPACGLEYLQQPARTDVAKKRYVIVGGGPAGMEAACRLDAAGHQVVLLEKQPRLGGTLRFASIAYAANERLLDYLERRIGKSGVDVRLKTEATPDLLSTLAPDEVIVATGAVRSLPDIPGNDLPHVFSGDDMRAMVLGESTPGLQRKLGMMTRLATKVGAASGLTSNPDFVRTATKQWMPLGDRIVIIGGELVGLELAEFLNERGRTVTVIEETSHFGRGLSIVRRARLVTELKEHGVALYASAQSVSIGKKAVSFIDAQGNSVDIPADHVIVAKGAHGDSTLADHLRQSGFAVREIGDGTGVGYIEGAIRGAANAVADIEAGVKQPVLMEN